MIERLRIKGFVDKEMANADTCVDWKDLSKLCSAAASQAWSLAQMWYALLLLPLFNL